MSNDQFKAGLPPSMRFNAFVQTVGPAVFGLGFIVFGLVAFVHLGSSHRKIEAKLESIRAGKVQPDTLLVVAKYIDPGKGAWPHIILSGGRQPKVNVAATLDFFNGVNPGDSVTGYYLPDGYFFPQNQRKDSGLGRWFLPGLGVLLGAGMLALSVARARSKARYVDMDAVRTTVRDRTDAP